MSIKPENKKPGDKFAWSTQKDKIDNTPRRPKIGEVVNILYGEFEEKNEERDGRFGKYNSNTFILKCMWNVNNSKLPGYCILNPAEFSEMAQKFEQANYPNELPFVRAK